MRGNRKHTGELLSARLARAAMALGLTFVLGAYTCDEAGPVTSPLQVGLPGSVTLGIDPAGDTDCFRITLVEQGLLLVDTERTEGSTATAPVSPVVSGGTLGTLGFSKTTTPSTSTDPFAGTTTGTVSMDPGSSSGDSGSGWSTADEEPFDGIACTSLYDPVLRLYEGNVQIASDDDSGPGGCPRLREMLDPGTYTVCVAAESSTTTLTGLYLSGQVIDFASAEVHPGGGQLHDEACTSVRWVGKVPAQFCVEEDVECPPIPCPQVPPGEFEGGHFAASHLFAPAALGGTDQLARELQRYCLWEWQPDVTPADPYLFTGPDLREHYSIDGGEFLGPPFVEVTGLQQDCMVAGMQGGPVETAVAPRLLTSHRAAAGATSVVASGFTPVRVAVVDAAPDNGLSAEPPRDSSGHGFAVGRVIRDLSCPTSGSCLGHVSTHLALPRTDPFTVDTEHGGYFGYQSEIAVGVAAAVEEWRAYNAAHPEAPQRLIVNLSVGWDRRWGGAMTANASPDNLDAPAQALFDALTDVVCLGGITLAAAGNATGGYDGDYIGHVGAMLPAAWSTVPAPSPQACYHFEGRRGAEVSIPPYSSTAPLVYAISGVDAEDHSLANARLFGRAHLVAPGEHVVAPDLLGGFTSPKTGSSMATATASAAVATAWALRNTSGRQIMSTLMAHSASVSLDPAPDGSPVKADFGLDAGQSVRRLSVCGAVQAACPGWTAFCPSLLAYPLCTPPGAYQGTTVTFDTDTVNKLNQAFADPDFAADADALAWDDGFRGLAECSHAPITRVIRAAGQAFYPSQPCAETQYYQAGALPWGGPQPGGNVCPHCSFGSGVLSLLISDEYTTNDRFTDLKLVTVDGAGRTLNVVALEDLGVGVLVGGQSARISGIRTLTGMKAAYLTGVYTNPRTLDRYAVKSDLILY